MSPSRAADVHGEHHAEPAAPHRCPGKPQRGELRALAGILVVFLVMAVCVLALGEPLGHDESVYATWARSWRTGEPIANVVADHRAPGLPLIAFALVTLTESEVVLRTIGLAFALLALVAMWWLGRELGGTRTGLLAAAVFGAVWSVLDAGTLLLTDLPATALLLLATALLVHEFAHRDRRSWWLLAGAPLCLGAIYLRYGSLLPLGLLGLGVVLRWWQGVRRDPVPAALTVLLAALLAVPLVVRGVALTGVPWGLFTTTADTAGRAYLGEGLVFYLRTFPLPMAGPLVPVLALIAVIASFAPGRWARTWFPWLAAGERRTLRSLVTIALGHVLLIGVVSHGEIRFVLFPVALLTAVGAAVIVRSVHERLRGTRLRTAVRLGVAAVGVTAVAATAVLVVHRAEVHEHEEGLRIIGERLAAASEDCAVMTSYGPQVAWYSGCAIDRFPRPPTAAVAETDGDRRRYLLLIDDGKRQPRGRDLQRLLRRLDARELDTEGRLPTTLYALP